MQDGLAGHRADRVLAAGKIRGRQGVAQIFAVAGVAPHVAGRGRGQDHAGGIAQEEIGQERLFPQHPMQNGVQGPAVETAGFLAFGQLAQHFAQLRHEPVLLGGGFERGPTDKIAGMAHGVQRNMVIEERNDPDQGNDGEEKGQENLDPDSVPKAHFLHGARSPCGYGTKTPIVRG